MAYDILPRVVNPTLKLQMQTPAYTQQQPSNEKTKIQSISKPQDVPHEKTEIPSISEPKDLSSENIEINIESAVEREESLMSSKFVDTNVKDYEKF